MAGEGSMMQAIKSLSYNKSLRNKHNRTSWKDYKTSTDKPFYDPIQATPELLNEMKTRLQTENKNRKKQLIVFVLIWILISIILFILSLYF